MFTDTVCLEHKHANDHVSTNHKQQIGGAAHLRAGADNLSLSSLTVYHAAVKWKKTRRTWMSVSMCRFCVFETNKTAQIMFVFWCIVVFENSSKPYRFSVDIHLHTVRAKCAVVNQTTHTMYTTSCYCTIFWTPLRDTSFGKPGWGEGCFGGGWEHLGFMHALV